MTPELSTDCQRRIFDNLDCVMWVLHTQISSEHPALPLIKQARDLLRPENCVSAVQRVAARLGCGFVEAISEVDHSLVDLLEKIDPHNVGGAA